MCTDAFKDEDFITSTIKQVDGYLAGERKDEEREILAQVEQAQRVGLSHLAGLALRLASEEAYARATSSTNADGYREGEDQDCQPSEWDAESLAAYDEWSAMVDDEEFWDKHCGKHGDERDGEGLCPQCRQELAQERIEDK